ncbi:MAG: DUF5060 domain-containing protein [Phycisphaerales bacterium]
MVSTSPFIVLALTGASLATHVSLAGPAPCDGFRQITASPIAWQPVTIDFGGPASWESNSDDNPFLEFRLDVTFSAPDGRTFRVPGFFDGDGAGEGGSEANPGAVWRVRFTPDAPGTWTWTTSFREGASVSIDVDPLAGSAGCIDGLTGSFSVAPPDPDADGYYARGRLAWRGGHYLEFDDGSVYVKAGVDSPENWLGYEGFDATPNANLEFDDHLGDWNPGDPDWDRTDPPGTGSGRAIIGAMNYLNDQGANSIYFLPMNVGGDAKDTWPWIGPVNRFGDPSNENLRFDISKLHQWTIALDHAQRKELMLHFVLNEAEAPNKRELDDAELGVERKLFYREMIARFGHFNAVQWNISEEYNLGLNLGPGRVFEWASWIRTIEPYGAPVAVHNTGNPRNAWAPFIGIDANDPDPNPIDLTSLQAFNEVDGLGEDIEWFRTETAAAGKPIPAMMDEPESIGDVPDFDAVRKRMLWDVLLSGGGVEWYLRTADQSLDDFRLYEQVWRESGIARRFVEVLPVRIMEPDDNRMSGADGAFGGPEVFVLAGEGAAIFLPDANPSGSLDLDDAPAGTEFTGRWFDPRAGVFAGDTVTMVAGANTDLGSPPSAANQDWVMLVQRSGAGVTDCNGNGWDDAVDIAAGLSRDANRDGVPDECDAPPVPCPADIDGDEIVAFPDLVALLGAWGDCPGCPADVDGDGVVGIADLLTVLAAWGPCPAA